MDANLTIYATASLVTAMQAIANTLEIAFSLDVLDSDAANSQSDYLNLKVSSAISPITATETKVSADVVAILHYILDAKQLYKLEIYKGQILKAMNECIALKVLGIGDASTETILDFFKLSYPVKIFDMEVKDPTTRARESVFIAHYETTLT